MKQKLHKGPSQARETKRTFMVKSYLLYKSLVSSIRNRYKSSKSNKDKRKISWLIVSRRILKCYVLGSFARCILGISKRHFTDRLLCLTSVKKLNMKAKVVEFFDRDDVSKMKPDKNATIARKGIKK